MFVINWTGGYLYRNIIPNEVQCSRYLQNAHLIFTSVPEDEKTCIKIRNDIVCAGVQKETTKASKKKKFWRYVQKSFDVEMHIKRMPNVSVDM